jgi:hypothetical protein
MEITLALRRFSLRRKRYASRNSRASSDCLMRNRFLSSIISTRMRGVGTPANTVSFARSTTQTATRPERLPTPTAETPDTRAPQAKGAEQEAIPNAFCGRLDCSNSCSTLDGWRGGARAAATTGQRLVAGSEDPQLDRRPRARAHLPPAGADHGPDRVGRRRRGAHRNPKRSARSGQLVYVRVPDRRYRFTSVWLDAADVTAGRRGRTGVVSCSAR